MEGSSNGAARDLNGDEFISRMAAGARIFSVGSKR
jgi:hypothetical protein